MKALVCGCGPSLAEQADLISVHCAIAITDWSVVATNYAARWLHPGHIRHLVVADAWERFDREKLACIAQAALYARTWTTMGLDLPNVLAQKVDTTDRLEIGHPTKVAAHITSTYIATVLAYRMGAKRIGVIGHDLVGHPVLSHNDFVGQIREAWADLHGLMQDRGVELVNLSPISLVDTFPQVDARKWLSEPGVRL